MPAARLPRAFSLRILKSASSGHKLFSIGSSAVQVPGCARQRADVPFPTQPPIPVPIAVPANRARAGAAPASRGGGRTDPAGQGRVRNEDPPDRDPGTRPVGELAGPCSGGIGSLLGMALGLRGDGAPGVCWVVIVSCICRLWWAHCCVKCKPTSSGSREQRVAHTLPPGRMVEPVWELSRAPIRSEASGPEVLPLDQPTVKGQWRPLPAAHPIFSSDPLPLPLPPLPPLASPLRWLPAPASPRPCHRACSPAPFSGAGLPHPTPTPHEEALLSSKDNSCCNSQGCF